MGHNDPDSDIVDDSQTINEDYCPVVKKKRGGCVVLHEWSDGDIVALIHAVETKPELWKCSDPGYKNRTKKDAAWRDIEENVFHRIIKTTEISAKWSNLRVQYKSYAAKYKNRPSGSGRSQIAKWKFFDAMNFVGAVDDLLSESTISNLPMPVS